MSVAVKAAVLLPAMPERKDNMYIFWEYSTQNMVACNLPNIRFQAKFDFRLDSSKTQDHIFFFKKIQKKKSTESLPDFVKKYIRATNPQGNSINLYKVLEEEKS